MNRLFAGVVFAVLLSGCSSVFVTEPVGETVEPLQIEQWQGSWTSGEFVLMTTVLEAETGLLEAAWLERGDAGARMERYEGQVRRTGDWLFINMTEPNQSAPAPDGEEAEVTVPEYLWARLSNDGRTVLMWWPSPEAFRTAVRDDRVPGVIKDDDDVRLEPLTPEQLAWINDPGSGLLSWQEPMVFVRIGD
ncbi:hypothetical protein [Elongatibacter sediminis]|uniref:Lipocalin-like domain-containing protein n=1 Tax=Elongatibacter sediminis TaxID=3119006 RepID=A0AAW9RJ08_9GAMM